MYLHTFLVWQLWTVALWLTQPMAKLVILLEQHLDKQPPTVVIQATLWWEVVLAHVNLQECGLAVHLPVKVCYYTLKVNLCMYSTGKHLVLVSKKEDCILYTCAHEAHYKYSIKNLSCTCSNSSWLAILLGSIILSHAWDKICKGCVQQYENIALIMLFITLNQ